MHIALILYPCLCATMGKNIIRQMQPMATLQTNVNSTYFSHFIKPSTQWMLLHCMRTMWAFGVNMTTGTQHQTGLSAGVVSVATHAMNLVCRQYAMI